MKTRVISLLLMILVPGICFGSSARYTQLVRQKQRKMEELQKCMGTNKNLQIAGLSTLGLTAVGVVANISEAKIIKTNEKTIEKNEDAISNKQVELAKKEKEIKDKKEAQERWDKEHTVSIMVNEDAAVIASLGGKIGDTAITSGYYYHQLPSSLSGVLGNAMASFVNNCNALVGHNGIRTVRAGSMTADQWKAYNGSGTLKEDDPVPNLDLHEIATCELLSCADDYHKAQDAEMCIKDEKIQTLTTETENNTTITTVTVDDDNTVVIDNDETFDDEDDEETTVVQDTPKVGAACPRDKLPDHAISGHYINVGGGVIKCAATKCDEAKGYELVEGAGWCRKKKAKAVEQTSVDEDKHEKSEGDAAKGKQDNNTVAQIEHFNQSNYSGSSICSSTPGTHMGQPGNPDLTGAGDTKHCWCKLDTVNSPWVFAITNTGAAECAAGCKTGCINGIVNNYSGFRDKITSKATVYNTQTVSVFKDVEVGGWDQCKSLAGIYMRQNALNLNFKDFYTRSSQYYLVYEDADSKQYTFEFDDCEESWPSQHRHEVARALCRVYGGSPTNEGKGVGCPSRQSATIRSDLASFNSAYSYGSFSVRHCGAQNTNCSTYSVTGFYWE